MYVVEKMQMRPLQQGAGRWIRLVPAGITTALIVTSPWTGLVFSLSDKSYFVHEALYLPMLLLASLYLVVVAVVGAVNMVRARTTFGRQANGALFASVLVIILFIVLDGTLSKASILPAAIFAVIVVIFALMQESNINSDALTGMNNRRKADEYLTERLASVSASDPMYLYMGDLNGFKGINDTYGHAEGDVALVLCSNVLKRTIGRYNGFAARFGGDEFLLTWTPGKGAEADPEALVRDVARGLEEASEGHPYRLHMSMGHVLCDDPSVSLGDYIKRADKMLYERKAAIGALR